MKKFRKKLLGFTLVEMVVVIALFGMIIAVALGMLIPVSKINKYALVSADTQAIEDGMRRFMEDNLQYSNRLAVYTGGEINVESEVANFRSKYYLESSSKVQPYDGYEDDVYVMTIENPDSIKNGDETNRDDKIGTIKLEVFKHGKTTSEASRTRTFGLNTDYYRDYAFNIDIGSMNKTSSGSYEVVPLNTVVDGGGTYVSANNFTFTIEMFKKTKDKSSATGWRLNTTGVERSVAFKLKNLVNDANAVKREKLVFTDGTIADPAEPERYYWYDNTKTNATHSDGFTKITSGEHSGEHFDKNSIYIIFTKPIDIKSALS